MRSERGVALAAVMMALVLLSSLGLALIATSAVNTAIAENFRATLETFYAADAVAARALVDLRGAADWTPVLRGDQRSTFVDGPPAGIRLLPDGTQVDLAAVVNLANCGKRTACSVAAMNAVTAERPWGGDNPRWLLFAYGPLSAIVPGPAAPGGYAVALVADDPAEQDGDPLRDAVAGEPGAGVLVLRVEAFGRRGARRALTLTLAHPPAASATHVLTWRP